ncbi:GPCR family 2 [Echinococcus multilocularis]|uniref:GPCR family 2 n=1 Tax=Echinococcus multilocularis TaxID=6211 RepID=A0A068Y783_ECHMU|nr:GPCR family 2 [Echinococcus multilocularis]
MRGLLLTAGIHLEPRVMAIGQCPLEAPPTLATLCSTDIPVFPPEVESVSKLQNQLLSKLKTGNKRNLGMHLNLAIRKVSPVVDSKSNDIYANIYCAQCHNVSSSKRIKRLPKRLLCDNQEDAIKCFVQAEMPKNVSFCDSYALVLRSFFTWDSIFTLPEEDEADTERSSTKSVFELIQWICCSLSMIALVIAIYLFASSARLRRPLPGKMMIALCCTLLSALVAFLLASGVMDFLSAPLRPMCVIFACLLQLLLLAAFVWMAIFATELLRTFGLTRVFQHAFLCYCCRKVRDKNTKAMGMMLRARGSDPNSNSRFKHQIIVAIILPLCCTIPTLIINEYAYHRLKPLYDTSANSNWSLSSQEAELGPALYRLNPGFCPVNNPNYAWFKGHHVGLLVWFLIPSGVTIFFNLFALIIVCIQICRLKRETGLSPSAGSPQIDAHTKPSKSIVAVCTKLAVILGASWSIQLLAGLSPQLELLRQLAGLVNSAQGGIIAVSMLASSKARRVMAQRLPAKCRKALGVSESASLSIQEMTTSAKSRSRLTGQINSQTTSLLQSDGS